MLTPPADLNPLYHDVQIVNLIPHLAGEHAGARFNNMPSLSKICLDFCGFRGRRIEAQMISMKGPIEIVVVVVVFHRKSSIHRLVR